jgi:glycosyltransferase involved in cell wall biosynthesis
MIKVVDIVYHHHSEFNKPLQVLEKHAPSLGFADFIQQSIQFIFVKHLDYNGIEYINGKAYAFFRGRNKFWYIPFKTHRYIKSQHPDIVLVEGLVFPLQLISLKWMLGKNCRIIVQHHGEKPFEGIKGLLQKIADRNINAYLFTSYKNAATWINKKIIRNPYKCKEVLEASTNFIRKDKLKSQARVGMSGTHNYLWVGRLNKNKDPITVLKAFKKYGLYHPNARLYMIYQDEDLLEEVKNKVLQSIVLEDAVKLIGKVDHRELPYWFSAANFFISGSLSEGSGYALLEAMACGCIPVITAIPSFEKITEKGKYGYLFPPGDVEALAQLLENLHPLPVEKERLRIEKYFREKLSFQSIADSLGDVINQL